ncbi:MAG: AraC family transcriptional regulator, partial [Kiritimatiellales bacterium]|nr:AraC family transcriptional regulator [Kiritimatiellales bacterium]
FFVDFAGRQAAQLLRNSPLGENNIVQVSEPGRLQEIFQSLQHNGSNETRFTPEICLTLLKLLFLKIEESAVPYGSIDTRGLTTYQRCKKFIDLNFLEIHSLEEIAAGCFINASYLCRNFKRFGHVSPYQYLLRLKMNHAVKLLLGSDMLVKQVAEELGFSDPYHFSRTFKSIYRISPEKFLKVGSRENRLE